MADTAVRDPTPLSGSDNGSVDNIVVNGHDDEKDADTPDYYKVTVTPDRRSSFSGSDREEYPYAQVMKHGENESEDALYEQVHDPANSPPEAPAFGDDDEQGAYELHADDDDDETRGVHIEEQSTVADNVDEAHVLIKQQEFQQEEEEEVFVVRSQENESIPRSHSPSPVAAINMEDDDGYKIHPAFAGIGQAPGLVIWKMELVDPVRLDESEHGQFYQNSAYVVLKTTNIPGFNRFSYDLHFWMGKGAPVEDCAAASLRSVELDEACLEGRATQYREVQGHESKTFMSNFRQGVQYYKSDGDKSGTKRMFRVRGKKNARIEQVQCNFSSLNKGDAFVVDNNMDIYVWIGPATTRKERFVGLGFARTLRDQEKSGAARIHVVDKDWNTHHGFFKVLGKREKEIRAAEDETLLDHIRKDEQGMTLFRIDENGSTKAIASRPLKQSLLESDNCYVLDGGIGGLFAWTGRDTVINHRANVWKAVNGFIDGRGYPSWVTVCRVAEGSETPLFKQYFTPWVDEYTREFGAVGEHRPPMVRKQSSKVEEWMPDDGDGNTQIWRVERNQLVPVPELARGVFFGGDCYIIVYTFQRDDEKLGVIYSWQGRNSTVADQTAAASHAVRLDTELGDRSVMVRIALRKEPTHFLRIFGGRVTYFKSGHVKGFRNFRDYDDYDPRATYMFQVTGNSSDEMRVIEVDARASSLNSNDIFIIYDNKRCYVWTGQYHSEAEAQTAKEIVEQMKVHKVEPEILKEDNESRMFWDVLNGREPYRTDRIKVYEGQRFEPRLFHCSFSSGRFVVEEIVSYVQTDLDDDDIMILDTYDEVFAWLGQNTKDHERRDAFNTANLYLSTDPSGRSPHTTLVAVVRQGYEPPQFVECFDDWNTQFWAERKTFNNLVDDVSRENKNVTVQEEESDKCTSFFTIEELQRKFPPEGVDVSKKEMYLTDGDFHKVFGMSRDAYIVLPGWKKTAIKKQTGLF